ncbi:MAG: exodeoxyribonuclease V subunit alpha [Chlamydiales bacterium]
MRLSAQELFLEHFGDPKWIHEKFPFKVPKKIEILYRQGKITPYELALIEVYGGCNEAVSCAIAALSLATKQGHICLRMKKDRLFPSIQELFSFSDSDFTHSSQAETLHSLVIKGLHQLPSSILHCVSDSEETIPKPFYRWEDDFYTQKLWVYETLLVNRYRLLSNASPAISWDEEAGIRRLKQCVAQGKLIELQAKAIETSLKHSVSFICGGPGTGKTYTAGMLLNELLESLPEDRRHRLRIGIAAPTGKAAARLLSSLSQSCPHLKDTKATTLHRLLGAHPNRPEGPFAATKLDHDLILVDECSMIDLTMMAALFYAVKPGSFLILLGDPHQLPPVESGHAFGDLVEACQQSQGTVVHLNRCVRTEAASILNFSQQILEGNQEIAHQLAEMEIEKIQEEKREELLKELCRFIPCPKFNMDPLDLLTLWSQSIILTPLRKGPYGTEQLNQDLLRLWWSKYVVKPPFTLPILITRHDKMQDLLNGDTGVLVCHREISTDGSGLQLSENDYALFPCQDSPGYRKIPAFLLKEYTLAFSLSVHKSQGSEYPHVILLLPEGAETFHREMLYTAVTRAKRSLKLWGKESTIKKIISSKRERLSSITSRVLR